MALITVGGLVTAYVGARREYPDAASRVLRFDDLSKAEPDETVPLMDAHFDNLPTDHEVKLNCVASCEAESDSRHAF